VPVLAPELVHEGAQLLRGVGELERVNVLRHCLYARSLTSAFARSGIECSLAAATLAWPDLSLRIS
jgi:hypothetical protein